MDLLELLSGLACNFSDFFGRFRFSPLVSHVEKFFILLEIFAWRIRGDCVERQGLCDCNSALVDYSVSQILEIFPGHSVGLFYSSLLDRVNDLLVRSVEHLNQLGILIVTLLINLRQ